jgi:hypothetical protein
MERQFWSSFWTLVDGSNELREISLHYHAVPHRILWTIPKTRHRTFWWRTHLSSNEIEAILKSNIVSFWKGKCRKHYLRISIVNALPVNCHPTVVAVDGRTSFKHDVNGALVGCQCPPHWCSFPFSLHSGTLVFNDLFFYKNLQLQIYIHVLLHECILQI